MFHVLWSLVLVALTAAWLRTWRRPASLRLPRAFWLTNLALALLVCLFTFVGLQTVFGRVEPFLEVERVQVPWPSSGALTLGREAPADVRLENRYAEPLHARIVRTGPGTAELLPLSAARRVEVNGIDAGAVDLARVSRLELHGETLEATGAGLFFATWRSGSGARQTARGPVFKGLLSLLPVVRTRFELPMGEIDESAGLTVRRPGATAVPGVHARIFRRDGRTWLGFASPQDRASSDLRLALTGEGSSLRPIQTVTTPLHDQDEITIGYTRYRVTVGSEMLELAAVRRVPRVPVPMEGIVLEAGGTPRPGDASQRKRTVAAALEPPATLWIQAAPGRPALVSPLGPGYWLQEEGEGLVGAGSGGRGVNERSAQAQEPQRDAVSRNVSSVVVDPSPLPVVGRGLGAGAYAPGTSADASADASAAGAAEGTAPSMTEARAEPGATLEADSPPPSGVQVWRSGTTLRLEDSRHVQQTLRYRSSFVPATEGLRDGAPFAGWWRLIAAAAGAYLALTLLLSGLGLLSPDNFLVFHLTALLNGLGIVTLAQLGLHSDDLRLEAYGPRQLVALLTGLGFLLLAVAWLSRGRRPAPSQARRSSLAGTHPFDRLDRAIWPGCPYPGGLVGTFARQPRVWILYLCSLGLLAVQLPFGETGISVPGLGSIQPIEAVKTLLLVYFAWWTARVIDAKTAVVGRPEQLRDRVAYLLHALPVLLILVLSYGLDDVSPILILSVFMYLMYRLSLVWPARGLERATRLTDAVWLETLVLLVLLPALVYTGVLPHRPSVFRRFLVWANPWENTGQADQIVGSLWSMLGVGGGGGLFGAGLGTPNGALPPAVQDDFILAFFGNKLGFAGIGLLMATYLLFLLAGVRAVRSVSLESRPDLGTNDRLERVRLLMTGGLLLFIVQLAVVFGSVTGGLPVVGQPLPFLSAGGSHLTLFCLPVAAFVVLGARWQAPAPGEEKRPWA